MTTERRDRGSHDHAADPRSARPWRRPSWPRSAWPTATPGSIRRSARSSWPGTGSACRPSRPPPTTTRSRPTTRPGPAGPPIAPSGCPDRLASAISKRLAGDRRVRIDLDLRGHTDFERDVWHKALEIPRGEVRPYGWVAAEIGRPKAVRAVGTALGHNPVPLIVPCHRVVRTDGSIGQYSLGGPGNKRTILADEGVDLPDLDGAGVVRGPLHRLGHDQDLLPADLPARPPGHRPAPPRVPLDGGRAGAWLPCLQGLPSGLGRRGRLTRERTLGGVELALTP